MPGSRRPFSRPQTNPPTLPVRTKFDASGFNNEDGIGGLAGLLLPPKHCHIPEIPVEGNVCFEFWAFMFAVVAMCLQYINLYKTVWWLPHSHATYALNFYLIDPYLVVFLVILMSRRLTWCFIKEVHIDKNNHSCLHWILQLIKAALLTCLIFTFTTTTYHIVLRHTLVYSLFLCYPLITYVILFGLSMKPLFGKKLSKLDKESHLLSCTGESSPVSKFGQSKSAGNTQSASESVGVKKREDQYSTDKSDIKHNCTSSPEAVRDEVDRLKTDFNYRIKQVLFNSMMCAYYMGFIPLCFAQNTLYYDTWWVSQHVVLLWIGAFIMYAVHFLPAKYVDVLHRCALHLGRWTKVEGRHAHVPYNAWSELQVWQQGALVKHVKGLFRAEGINNSAEPGNGMHSRFYFLFQPPLRMTTCLLVITLLLVSVQFILLVQAIEWSHIVSLALLMFSNYYLIFKLIRDFLVLKRAYKDEQTSFQN